MTTFTTEDRVKAYEDRDDRERRLNGKVQELQAEIRSLKIEIKHQKDRAKSWQDAYDNAMAYAKKLLARGKA